MLRKAATRLSELVRTDPVGHFYRTDDINHIVDADPFRIEGHRHLTQ
jgi:hypothetical protein